MDKLPEEIERLIGDQLDLETAKRLALVSSGVRDIGERRVWQSLDMSLETYDNGQ